MVYLCFSLVHCFIRWVFLLNSIHLFHLVFWMALNFPEPTQKAFNVSIRVSAAGIYIALVWKLSYDTQCTTVLSEQKPILFYCYMYMYLYWYGWIAREKGGLLRHHCDNVLWFQWFVLLHVMFIHSTPTVDPTSIIPLGYRISEQHSTLTTVNSWLYICCFMFFARIFHSFRKDITNCHWLLHVI